MKPGSLIRINGRAPTSTALLKLDARSSTPNGPARSLGVLSRHRFLVDMNLARQAQIFGEPKRHYMSDLQMAEEIAWLFLEGFGVERKKLDHQLLKELPDESARFYGTSFNVNNPPYLFENTKNHSLISYEINEHRYPLALVFEDMKEVGPYQSSEWRRLALMPQMPSYEIPEQFKLAMRKCGRLLRHEAYKDDKYISYAPYRSGSVRKALPRFPGIFPPESEYSKALLRCAMQRIEYRCRVKDDVRVLVLGSGSGVEGVEIARQLDLSVDCLDVQPLAVANTKASALYAGVDHIVHAWQSDGFDQVKGRYDFILFNAPLAVHQGRDHPNLLDIKGKLLRRIFSNLPKYLRENGRMLLMSHDNIDEYRPAKLRSEMIYSFTAGSIPLAIHEVKVA